jgi:hypothetical protein
MVKLIFLIKDIPQNPSIDLEPFLEEVYIKVPKISYRPRA